MRKLCSPCRCLVKMSDCPNKQYPKCIETCEAMHRFRLEELDKEEICHEIIDCANDNRYSINYLSMWE